ncbi:MAG: rhomboid family GlyGly-CTERM serine protease [Planctomycetota bacterium]
MSQVSVANPTRTRFESFAARLGYAAALAFTAWVAGGLPSVFELDRSALEAGQLWRLWTGHLVHGNANHYNYDVAAATLLLLAFGPSRRLLWMAPTIGVALLAAWPQIDLYYGLSALLHAWVVTIAADSLREERGSRRVVAGLLLAGVVSKASLETWLGESLFTSPLDFGGPVLHCSHWIGAMIGLLPLCFHSLKAVALHYEQGGTRPAAKASLGERA